MGACTSSPGPIETLVWHSCNSSTLPLARSLSLDWTSASTLGLASFSVYSVLRNSASDWILPTSKGIFFAAGTS